MTKKTYEQVAQALYTAGKETAHVPGSAFVLGVADSLIADVFAKDNPRFNRAKFREACLTGKGIRKG